MCECIQGDICTCPLDENRKFQGSNHVQRQSLQEQEYGKPYQIKVADIWVLPRMVDVSRIDAICLATQTDCIRFMMEMDLPVPKTKHSPVNDFVYPDLKWVSIMAEIIQDVRIRFNSAEATVEGENTTGMRSKARSK